MSELKVLDTDRLDMLFGGELSLVREIYQIAATDFPKTSDRLAEALEKQDLEGIKQYSHTLKGSIANVGGQRASELANEICTAARADDIARCVELYPQFKRELDEFCLALGKFAKV